MSIVFHTQIGPLQPTATIPPHVGTIDLIIDEQKKLPSLGYDIAFENQLQIATKDLSKYLMKLFSISYEVSSILCNTKTFSMKLPIYDIYNIVVLCIEIYNLYSIF
ncbi:unnamed protein product [Cunninghamella echinulata]